MPTYVNPMEWIGEAHNAAIRYAFAGAKKKPSLASIQKRLVEYFAIAGMPARKTTKMTLSFNVQEVLRRIEKDGSASRPVVRALAQLVESTMHARTLSEALREIKDHEMAALKTLKGANLLDFQAGAAIARHSATLWAPTNQGGEGYLSKTGGPTPAGIWGPIFTFDYTYHYRYPYGNVDGATLSSVSAAFVYSRNPDIQLQISPYAGPLSKIVIKRQAGGTTV